VARNLKSIVYYILKLIIIYFTVIKNSAIKTYNIKVRCNIYIFFLFVLRVIIGRIFLYANSNPKKNKKINVDTNICTLVRSRIYCIACHGTCREPRDDCLERKKKNAPSDFLLHVPLPSPLRAQSSWVIIVELFFFSHFRLTKNIVERAMIFIYEIYMCKWFFFFTTCYRFKSLIT